MAGKKQHYNAEKLLSHNQARIFVAIGAKNIGKTFSTRVEVIKRCIKHGTCFCEISRYKDENAELIGTYFDKIQKEGYFKKYRFTYKNKAAYIAEINPAFPDEPKEDKNKRLICYFVSLNEFQSAKKRSYLPVEFFIFDEFVIEKHDRFHSYLKKETSLLSKLIDSVAREKTDEQAYDWEQETGEKYYKPKLVMMGNACDITCPYFEWMGLKDIPDYGYHWFRERGLVFDYAAPLIGLEENYNTLAGLIIKGDEEASVMFENKFSVTKDAQYIEKKTSKARFWISIKFSAQTFGLWLDYDNALCYVNNQVPNNSDGVTYAFTDDDNELNYTVLKRSDTVSKQLSSMYYSNLFRYETIPLKGAFVRMLAFLGVKE